MGLDEVSTTAPSPTLKKKNNPLEPMSADNLSVALSVVYSDAIGKRSDFYHKHPYLIIMSPAPPDC